MVPKQVTGIMALAAAKENIFRHTTGKEYEKFKLIVKKKMEFIRHEARNKNSRKASRRKLPKSLSTPKDVLKTRNLYEGKCKKKNEKRV